MLEKIKYGLIGYPLTHSFSRRFFTEKFKKEKIPAEYNNYEIDDISLFPDIINNERELKGLNVTLPYKEKIIPYLNELDSAAKKIGAVNTIKIKRTSNNITLKGYNTDTFGFEKSLIPLLKNYHKNALILGTGGASKAIKYVLKKNNINYLLVSRKRIQEKTICYNDIDQNIISDHLLIINATPLGTYPHTKTHPSIPYNLLSNKHILYDLVYNPEVTEFMKNGKKMGATVKNGYEMLLLQAIRSYKIWNDD